MEVDPNNMSDQESNRIRRIVGWSIIGLMAVIGLSIALSFYFALRPGGGLFHYPFFFPFHFGWLGVIFLIFLNVLGSKMVVFLAWERKRRRRRLPLAPAPAKTGSSINCQREICKR